MPSIDELVNDQEINSDVNIAIQLLEDQKTEEQKKALMIYLFSIEKSKDEELYNNKKSIQKIKNSYPISPGSKTLNSLNCSLKTLVFFALLVRKIDDKKLLKELDQSTLESRSMKISNKLSEISALGARKDEETKVLQKHRLEVGKWGQKHQEYEGRLFGNLIGTIITLIVFPIVCLLALSISFLLPGLIPALLFGGIMTAVYLLGKVHSKAMLTHHCDMAVAAYSRNELVDIQLKKDELSLYNNVDKYRGHYLSSINPQPEQKNESIQQTQVQKKNEQSFKGKNPKTLVRCASLPSLGFFDQKNINNSNLEASNDLEASNTENLTVPSPLNFLNSRN